MRLGLYHANDPTPAQLAINSDDKLQKRIDEQSPRAEATAAWRDKPPVTSTSYNLRSCRHNLSLSVKTDDRNFIIRQLFRDSY